MARQASHPAGRAAALTGSLPGALATRPHGRGSRLNPANRFESLSLDVLPSGGGDDDLIFEQPWERPDGPQAHPDPGARHRTATRVYRDRARTILNPVDAPDLSFKWSINPYRGCEHGCVYCYARPTHETLGLSCGLDFETRIFAKVDAAELLLDELARPGWRGMPVMLSGITDCYQPVERSLKITRRILEVMADCGQPAAVVTKSALVLRDADLLARLAAVGAASVAISITSLDAELSASLEPRAASPQRRLSVVRELAHAGIPVSVLVSPIIPGINDREIPAILQASAEAGARSAGYVILRLPWQVKAVFLDWLEQRFPQRAAHVRSLIEAMRDGKLYDARFKVRMRGEGPFAEHIRKTFEVFARRYGLDRPRENLKSEAFRRPRGMLPDAQLQLFSLQPTGPDLVEGRTWGP